MGGVHRGDRYIHHLLKSTNKLSPGSEASLRGRPNSEGAYQKL